MLIRERSLRRRRGEEDVRWCWEERVMLCKRVAVFVGAGGASSCGGGGASSSVSEGGSRRADASSRSVCADFQGARGKSSGSGGDSGLGLRRADMSFIVGTGKP